MIDNDAYHTEEGLASIAARAASDEDFPQYGYGLVQAFSLALALGEGGVSILELGVAGGNGVVALERLCAAYRPTSGLNIDLCGFDLGSGMPAPRDYRDAPYVWQQNFFKMDEAKLRARLGSTRLFIGDIQKTGREYIDAKTLPIGFISFDLDYYSSTVSAFDALLEGDPQKYLPRVVCYFDDTVGPHAEMHNEYAGELLAIKEFNETHKMRKIVKLNGLRYKLLPIEGSWVEGIYVLHLFEHPKYNQYVYPVMDRQFPLAEGER